MLREDSGTRRSGSRRLPRQSSAPCSEQRRPPGLWKSDTPTSGCTGYPTHPYSPLVPISLNNWQPPPSPGPRERRECRNSLSVDYVDRMSSTAVLLHAQSTRLCYHRNILYIILLPYFVFNLFEFNFFTFFSASIFYMFLFIHIINQVEY